MNAYNIAFLVCFIISAAGVVHRLYLVHQKKKAQRFAQYVIQVQNESIKVNEAIRAYNNSLQELNIAINKTLFSAFVNSGKTKLPDNTSVNDLKYEKPFIWVPTSNS